MSNRLFPLPTSLAAAILAGMLPLPAAAVSTFTVANDAPSGPGSFVQAVSDAAAVPSGESAEIIFDEVFFAEPRTLVMTVALPVVRKSLTISGPPLDDSGAPRLVLSGDANGSGAADEGDLPGLQVEVPVGGNLTVRRAGFVGFRSTATPGGALYFRPAGPASVVIENCVFRGNVARWGGAVAVPGLGNEATVRDCVFEENGARDSDGGALYLGTTPGMVERCIFRKNSAPRAGAIFTVHGATELRTCFFEQNEARGFGEGGAVSARSGLRVIECTFAGNTARAGGALFLNQMTSPAPGAIIENSTFSGNAARTGPGGAIYAVGTQAALRHCTLTLNLANRDADSNPFASGGGIAVPGEANVNRIELHNCVLAGNQVGGPGPAEGADIHGPASSFVSLGGNLVGIGAHLAPVFTQAGDLSGSPAQPVNALLGSLASNGGSLPTHLPHAESPVIDIGVPGPGTPLVVDQRGMPRPGGSAPDAGAVELVTLGFPAWAHFFLGGVGATLPGPGDPVVLAPHQLPDADPDRDGVPNVLEYLSGGDPLTPSWSALTRPRYSPATSELGVRYLVAAHVVPGSVEVHFEFSENFEQWDPVAPVPEASLVGLVGSAREMEVVLPGVTTATGFVRMTARLVGLGEE